MKTLRIIVMALMLLVATASSAIAQNQVELKYSQIEKLHGFQIYGNEYVHPGVSTNVSGIDISAISHLGENNDNIENWDTRVGYCLPIDSLAVSAAYGYLILPNQDAQEVSMTVGMTAGISPRYTFSHIELSGAPSGQVHTIGLDVPLGDPKSISAMLSLDAVYNNGFNPLGRQEIQCWTHATAGLVVDIPMGNFSLRPGVMYQLTFEPEALRCKENEVWWTLGLNYAF